MSSSSSPSSQQTIGDSLQTAGYLLLNKTTVTILCAGLAIYLLYSLGHSIFAPRSGGYDGTSLLAYSRGVDIAALVILLALIYSTYTSLNKQDQSNLLGWFLRWSRDFWNDPNTFLEITLFTIIFFIMVYLFRVPMAPEIKPVIVHLIETKIWIVYAMFIVIFFFKYVLKIPIIDLIYNNQVVQYFENLPSMQWSSAPGTAPSSSSAAADKKASGTATSSSSAAANKAKGAPPGTAPSPSPAAAQCASAPAPNKEVFNLSNQVYTYDEAREVCKAFGADLANYDQVEQAYLNNGEWCNYAWSDQQLALMPTQKDTFNKLQRTTEKNACGRPGVNGGFIGNTALRFGANCYGVKPPQPSGFVYDNPIQTLLAAAPDVSAMPSVQDLWKATAKLNAFNNLQRDWSQY